LLQAGIIGQTAVHQFPPLHQVTVGVTVQVRVQLYIIKACHQAQPLHHHQPHALCVPPALLQLVQLVQAQVIVVEDKVRFQFTSIIRHPQPFQPFPQAQPTSQAVPQVAQLHQPPHHNQGIIIIDFLAIVQARVKNLTGDVQPAGLAVFVVTQFVQLFSKFAPLHQDAAV
jgi:hypothetical protein